MTNSEKLFLVASESYLKRYVFSHSAALPADGQEIDLKLFHQCPFTMNFTKSTLFQMVEQHLNSYDIKLNNVLFISDYDVQISLCRAGHAAAFCPQIILPTILKDNNNHSKGEQIHAFSIANSHQTLRFELIYNGLLHYPKYAWDCFKLLKDIARTQVQIDF